MIAADAEEKEEKGLIQAGYNLKADVLRVGHHGKDTSSSIEFLKEVSPKYAVISNALSDENSKTLSRIVTTHAQIWQTAYDGTIEMTTDGVSIQIYGENEYANENATLEYHSKQMEQYEYVVNKNNGKVHKTHKDNGELMDHLPKPENREYYDSLESIPEKYKENGLYDLCGTCFRDDK